MSWVKSTRRTLLTGFSGLALLSLPSFAAAPEERLILELSTGKLAIDFRSDLAPNHVARIKELVRQGFYDGVVFHRVIEGFMAQTGDPTGTGMGGSGVKLNQEFSSEKHRRGTVSMARLQNPNSADSQFFICFADKPHLDGAYTIWGRVSSGMEAVDRLRKGDPKSGLVSNPDQIVKAYLQAVSP